MTPQGVEQLIEHAAKIAPTGVRPTMTPQGVEQSSTTTSVIGKMPVRPTMTPQGVEQNGQVPTPVVSPGETDDDAARR